MEKKHDPVVSVRIPDGVLEEVNKWVDNSPVKISRSAAIVYLLTKGLQADNSVGDKNG